MKQGFSTPTISDEYGSARNANLSCNKFGAIFSALLAKKQDVNTFDDKIRRKLCLTPKDQWLVTQRSKPAVDIWFKDLANGSKSLSHLAKKVPICNKREDSLQYLFEYQVPMSRAAFYVKASTAVLLATAETGNKSKKRQAAEPSQEWTAAICKGLRELFNTLSEHYNQTGGISSLSSSAGLTSSPEALLRWNYLIQFARHMFEESLLDRCEFLTWLEDLFEKIKPEDPVLRLIAPQLLHYSEDFSDNELLSRKLAYHCAKRLNILLQEPGGPEALRDGEPAKSIQQELLSCPHHRSMTLIYSAIIQGIAIKCRTALVWHHASEGKSPASLSGSPLDHLPCPPSALPIAKNAPADAIRQELREAEEEIRIRSTAVDNKWTSDRLQTSHSSPTICLLPALDVLDKHCFDRIEAINSLDTLYHKIFSNIPHQRNADVNESDFVQETVNQDEAKIQLLCEWAVTHKRTGEYRSMVVAKLLERRQSELLLDKDGDGTDDKESEAKAPVFQQILVNFLDTQAPVLDERNSRPEVRVSFSNLVLLFSELIRIDVFSHDAYMCTLISRGLFAENAAPSAPSQPSDIRAPASNPAFLTGFNHSSSHVAVNGMTESLHRNPSDSSLSMFGDPADSANRDSVPWITNPMEMDDAGIDADLDKLLQNIKEGQRDSMHDQDILLPDTVTPEKEEEGAPATTAESHKHAVQRHITYTTHFPLPQDETTVHECNQRHILLYGVGKARDEARHAVKKATKDMLKLFSRKASMDLTDGGKVKKSAVKDGFSFESALSRFQNLPFFDQHAVTGSCATTCIEMLNAVATGSANYLPLVESIAFLFDLMDMALNVHGMIDFIIQMLKELPEVDVQLQQKCSILTGKYASSIGLYIVGVLFRYQPCLLTSPDDTMSVFGGCLNLVKHVTNPADCSSAERCILGYIFDLYSSCSTVQSKYHDTLSPLLKSVKQVIYTQLQPTPLNLLCSTNCLMDYITNPRSNVDASVLKQLKDNPSSRYSFVCNAVRGIAMTRDPNHLNELAILCAELSSRCPPLSTEWISVLKALCCSSNHACGFIDALSTREISDLSIHDNLAIFTSILVARRCFTLQDFVIHCALPSLLAACPQGGGDIEAESGARLTCHLLLCLFRTSEPPLSSTNTTVTPATTLYSLTSPGPANLTPNTNRPTYVIKHPCDRYLLAAAHSCMRVEAVIAVLKAILVLGDANSDLTQRQEVNISDLLERIDDFNDFVLPNFSGNSSGNRSARTENIETAGLGEFAKHALKQICSQEWVHEKCLRNQEMLCNQDLLLDTMLTSRQAQLLLDMICHPKGSGTVIDSEQDQKLYIYRILQTLDEWTLRISWLQLQLIYAQCNSSQSSNEVNTWLENVAKATIEFFQNCSEDSSTKSSPRPNNSKSSKGSQAKVPAVAPETGETKESRVWLVAPLIEKLPTGLQGKILRVAANVLEAVNWMAPVPPHGSKNKDRSSQPKAASASSVLLSYPPFLSLVLACLKGQDEQRETLLKSLYTQLEQAVGERPTDDYKTKLTIHDGLQLRLSLVGGMFDMITKSNTVLGDWSLLFLNLIANGVVDPQLNYELFTTVADMLTVLIHATQVPDVESKEESKRHYHYQSLMKKLRKDLPTDRTNFGINILKQLVPLSKHHIDVITCEPMGSLIDTKGNKIAGFDSIDKKQGLQVANKVQVNPWELLEGQKNPPPLSWSWFGVVKYERKPLRCDEVVNSLQWHSHSLKKPSSYFLEQPIVPPEEIEPSPVPVPPPVADVKPVIAAQPVPHLQPFAMHPNPEDVIKRETVTPTEILNSPRGGAKPKQKQTRKRRAAKSPVSMPGHQTPPVRMPPSMSPAFDPNGYAPTPPQQPPPPNQSPWYNAPPSQMGPGGQGPPVNQQAFYSHPPNQPMPPAAPPPTRYERNPGPGKAALGSMLRAKNQPPYGMPQQANAVQAGAAHSAMFQQRGMSVARNMRPGVTGQPVAQNQMMMQQQNQGLYPMQNQSAGQHQHAQAAGGGYGGHQAQGMQYQHQMNQMPGAVMQPMDQSHAGMMGQNMNQIVNQGMNQMMGQPVGQGNPQQSAMSQGYGQQPPNQMMQQQRSQMQPQSHHMQPQQQQFMQR